MKKTEIKKSEGRGKDASTKLYGTFSMPETFQELKTEGEKLSETDQRSLLRILENGLLVTARPKFEENEKSPATFKTGAHLSLEQLLQSRSRQAGVGALKTAILALTSDFVAGKITADVMAEKVKSLQGQIDKLEADKLAKGAKAQAPQEMD